MGLQVSKSCKFSLQVPENDFCCVLGKVGYNDWNATCCRSIGGEVYYVENVREVNQ